MSRFAAVFTLGFGIVLFVGVGRAQAQITSWSLPEGTLGAPGIEHAYIAILPTSGSATTQYVALIIARDGAPLTDLHSIAIPANQEAGRRVSIDLDTLPEFVGQNGVQVFSARVSCPNGCTAQLIQRPADAATFWSGGRTVNFQPEIQRPPDVVQCAPPKMN
jgi:hypothetical protein